MDKLFVYGTLQPDFANHYILQNIGGICEKAFLFGYDFDRMWEKKTGYPGLIVGKSSSKIAGYLFTSKNLGSSWQYLDDFETDAYLRTIVTVTLPGNVLVKAFTYLINPNFNLKYF